MNRTYLTATGQFRIDPPLTWAEFKDSPYRPENERSEPDVLFEIETTEIDSPDGMMLLHRAVAVRPYSDRPFAYHRGLIPTMQALVNEHATHTFTGHFQCQETSDYTVGDLYRIVVRSGVVVTVKPEITWPED
jgi:hypothetical protein